MFESKSWKETYKVWTMIVERMAPELKTPVPFEHITFTFDRQGMGIYGYDWIRKESYKKRTEFVRKDPVAFLMFGKSLNKGTIQTAEYLVDAEDNVEKLALIWLASFLKDLERDKSQFYRRNSRFISTVLSGLFGELNKYNYRWHHAMRRLLPVKYTRWIHKDLHIDHISSLVELAALNAKMIYTDYKIVLYESVGKG